MSQGIVAARLRARFDWVRSRQVPWIAAFAITILDLVFLFRTAALTSVNSDHVMGVLAAKDVLHGNLLLHGWFIASDNFVLSDVPIFVLTRLLFGQSLLAIYAAPFLIYTVILIATAGIVCAVKRSPRARWIGLGSLLVFIGTPALHGAAIAVLVGYQHIGPEAFSLLAWWALDRAVAASTPQAMRRRAACFAIASLIAVTSDPLTIVVFVIPTLLGLAIAVLVADRRLRCAGLLAVLAGVVVASGLLLSLINAGGGFTIVPNQILLFIQADQLFHNIRGLFFSLQTLSGGYLFNRSLTDPATVAAMIRLVGLIAILGLTLRRVLRGMSGSGGWSLPFVMSAAVWIDLLSCLTSQNFNGALGPAALVGIAAMRYLTPVFLYGGVVAALDLPDLLSWVEHPAKRRAGAILATAAGTFVVALFFWHGAERWQRPPAMAGEPARLDAIWLEAHGLTHGIGGYWHSMSVTALSNQKVTVRAMRGDGTKLAPLMWSTNGDWYTAMPPPQFAILGSGTFDLTQARIAAMYGTPVSIHHVAGATIDILAHH